MTGRKELRIFGIAAIASLMLTSCGGGEEESDSSSGGGDSTVTIDPNRQGLETSVGGFRFSIPSPIQTATLIKETGATFNKDMLNPHDKISNYSTTFHKALNLGVYGADLGYLTIYQNTNDALSYLASVEKLANEIGVAGAFNQEIIERFSDNLGNRDSMLVLVSEAYRDGNNYLQTEEKYDVIALILAGGWVESLHFACQVAQENHNQEVINRIGDQKSSLESLISLLEMYRNNDLYDDLVQNLYVLLDEFNKLEYTYNYSKPKTLADRKVTYLTSSTNVTMTDENLNNISEIIADVRMQMVE